MLFRHLGHRVHEACALFAYENQLQHTAMPISVFIQRGE